MVSLAAHYMSMEMLTYAFSFHELPVLAQYLVLCDTTRRLETGQNHMPA